MEKKDTIVRDVEIQAPVEFVWECITRPEHLVQWFGDRAEVDLRVGGAILFGWEDDVARGEIVTVDPPHEFAFRWENNVDVPDLDQPPVTLVTYRLEAITSGTRLTVIESGFASLRDDAYSQAYPQNESGWRVEIEELVAYIAGQGVSQSS
jgi:uncharacterized protein YndB with AHSA1/START domain